MPSKGIGYIGACDKERDKYPNCRRFRPSVGLINYASYHFSTEEEWMQTHSFPDDEYRVHAREHALFVDAVRKLRTRMYAGDDIFADMLDFASQWLVDHITKTDVNYAKFARGLKQGKAD